MLKVNILVYLICTDCDFNAGHNKKVDSSKTSKDHLLETAQEQVNHLTQEITKLKCEQQELDEVIESLKNKVQNCYNYL